MLRGPRKTRRTNNMGRLHVLGLHRYGMLAETILVGAWKPLRQRPGWQIRAPWAWVCRRKCASCTSQEVPLRKWLYLPSGATRTPAARYPCSPRVWSCQHGFCQHGFRGPGTGATQAFSGLTCRCRRCLVASLSPNLPATLSTDAFIRWPAPARRLLLGCGMLFHAVIPSSTSEANSYFGRQLLGVLPRSLQTPHARPPTVVSVNRVSSSSPKRATSVKVPLPSLRISSCLCSLCKHGARAYACNRRCSAQTRHADGSRALRARWSPRPRSPPARSPRPSPRRPASRPARAPRAPRLRAAPRGATAWGERGSEKQARVLRTKPGFLEPY
jgi:hypothetical protein